MELLGGSDTSFIGGQGYTERQKVAGDTILGLPPKCLKLTTLSSIAVFHLYPAIVSHCL